MATKISKKSQFLKILQGVGLATVGTILAQPEVVTGSLTPGTQAKVIGIIAIINALLPAVWGKKIATPTTEE